MPLITNVSYRAFFPPFDLTGFTFDSEFSVVADHPGARVGDLTWNNNGTKVYVTDLTPDGIWQYSLSDPYNITTATATDDGKFGDTSGETLNPYGTYITPDGFTCFVMSTVGQLLYQYDLSVAFDISTMTYSGISERVSDLPPAGQLLDPRGLDFSPDGSRFFVANRATGIRGIYEMHLSTNWDINSATFVSSLTGSAQLGTVKFQNGGRSMSTTDTNVARVYTYTLTVPYDITSATQDATFLSVGAQDSIPYGVAWNPKGTVLHVGGFANGNIYKYVKT